MAAEESTAVVHRFLDEVINQRGPGAPAALCDADSAWRGASLGEARGLEAVTGLIGPFFAAFPDLRDEVGELLAEGDQVRARSTWRGTQRGEFFGVPPTGKEVAVAGISTYRVAGGKVAEEWWLEDLLGLVQQLGAIPTPGQGAG
jgi:predicted ester cyclase